MWSLRLLIAVVSWALARAAQANYTIDDSSPLIEYRAALWARNTMGFNISQLNNGTVTFVHLDPNGTPTIAMNFSGTAVYIFVAYPSGKQATVPLGFVARIDDFASGEWTADELAPLNNYLAFSNNTLSNKPHTLLLQLNPGASLYFDYAIVTSDADPNSAPTSSPSEPPARDGLKPKKKPPVGAIVGGVVGGLLLIALVSTPLLLRRRAMARKKLAPIPSIVPFIVEPPTSSARDEQADKEAAVVPPFILKPPPPPRSAASSGKSALSVRIPSARPPMGTEMQTSLSATSPVLTQMAEEMRRITMSVQRLESGIPEAQDGGPILQRPPAYGNRRE